MKNGNSNQTYTAQAVYQNNPVTIACNPIVKYAVTIINALNILLRYSSPLIKK